MFQQFKNVLRSVVAQEGTRLPLLRSGHGLTSLMERLAADRQAEDLTARDTFFPWSVLETGDGADTVLGRQEGA